jgi:bacterioferritin
MCASAMQGDSEIIVALNEQLTAELTAINQYFLHAKMQENWGYAKLARHTREESVDEMRHADRLADRILFLEGLPNFQRLNPLSIGQNVPEQLRADLTIETEAISRLRESCRLPGDRARAERRSRGTALPATLHGSVTVRSRVESLMHFGGARPPGSASRH